MWYGSIESDNETIASIKNDIESGKAPFSSFKEPLYADDSISWYGNGFYDDEVVSLIEKYPKSELEIDIYDDEDSEEGFSYWAPGDGTAVSVSYDFTIIDEEEFDERVSNGEDLGYSDWYEYSEDSRNVVLDNPENKAKTSSRAEKFV